MDINRIADILLNSESIIDLQANWNIHKEYISEADKKTLSEMKDIQKEYLLNAEIENWVNQYTEDLYNNLIIYISSLNLFDPERFIKYFFKKLCEDFGERFNEDLNIGLKEKNFFVKNIKDISLIDHLNKI